MSSELSDELFASFLAEVEAEEPITSPRKKRLKVEKEAAGERPDNATVQFNFNIITVTLQLKHSPFSRSHLRLQRRHVLHKRRFEAVDGTEGGNLQRPCERCQRSCCRKLLPGSAFVTFQYISLVPGSVSRAAVQSEAGASRQEEVVNQLFFVLFNVFCLCFTSTSFFSAWFLKRSAWQGLDCVDRLLLVDSSEDGLTALHLATIGGHEAVCRALLEGRADLDARSSQQDTPLMWAAHLGSFGCSFDMTCCY